MPAPSQMFENFLEPLRGWYEDAALVFTAKLASNLHANAKPLPGRCVTLNSSGAFVMGMSTLTAMPMFIFQGKEAFDVSTPYEGSTPGGYFVSKNIMPKGMVTALVGTGGYELSTTEYDVSKNYAPNQFLTAWGTEAGQEANWGRLTNVKNAANAAIVLYEDPICGVVSTGEGFNEYNVPTLSFWTVYLPARTFA
jgi:hypothetical protein